MAAQERTRTRLAVFLLIGCIAVVAAALCSLAFGSTQIPLHKVVQALTMAAQERTRTRLAVFLLIGCIAVVAAALCSLAFGSTQIPLHKVVQALTSPDLTDSQQIAVVELRVPRTIGDILVGAAFAVAGAVMQGVTRNPLADSGLLGINSGASFALALCLAFFPSFGFTGSVIFSFVGATGATRNPLADSGLLGINSGASFALALCLAFFPSFGFTGSVIFSFVGATGAMALVYGLTSAGHRRPDPVRLVLAGCVVGMLLSAFSQAIAIFANVGQDLTFWTAGGVAGIRMKQLALAGPVIAVGLIASIALSRQISLLSLGEDAARGLGVSVARTQGICMVVVLLLAGAAVALAGPIAFVGLMVPHVVRHFVGGSYQAIIPASMVLGAVFMLVADVISRVIDAPSEVPIGLVFAVIGVPFFIWIARREERTFE